MKATLHPTAPMYSKNGKDIFRYLISGTPAELKDYKAVKGEYHRVDENTKQPLMFSVNYLGKSAELRKIEKQDGTHDFVVNDDEIRMFSNLVKKYGIDTAKVVWEKDNRKAVETSAKEEKDEQ